MKTAIELPLAALQSWSSPAFMRQTLLILALLAVRFPANGDLLSPPELAEAKRIYDSKCSKCHRAHNPAEYAPEEWQLWTQKMTKKAKLDAVRESLLIRYLIDLRAAHQPQPLLSGSATPAGAQQSHLLASPKESSAILRR